MKTILALSVIALTLCFFSETSAQVAVEEVDCEPGKVWHDGCVRKECSSDGKRIDLVHCGMPHCTDGLIYNPGEEGKPFPDCCPRCDAAR